MGDKNRKMRIPEKQCIRFFIITMILLAFTPGCKNEKYDSCLLSDLTGEEFITTLSNMMDSEGGYGEELSKCLKAMLVDGQYKQLGRQLYWLRHGNPPEPNAKRYLTQRYVVEKSDGWYFKNIRLLGYWVGGLQKALHSEFYATLYARFLKCNGGKAVIEILRQIFFAAAENETADFKRFVDIILTELPYADGCPLYTLEHISLQYKPSQARVQFYTAVIKGRSYSDLCQ